MLNKSLSGLIFGLILLVLAMYSIRITIIEPTLDAFTMMPGLKANGFLVLVCSIVSMIIAAWILIEKRNQRGFFIASAISMLGFIFLAKSSQVLLLAVFPIFIMGLIWFYQINYRFQPWLGMTVKSLLIAAAFIFLLTFEPAFYRTYFAEQKSLALFMLKIISIYSAFIALFFIVEKLLSDLYLNFKGTQNTGSMVQTFGETYTRVTVTIFILIMVAGIGYLQVLQLKNNSLRPFIYLLSLIQFPSLLILILLYLPPSKEIFKILSVLTHLILIGGTFSISILYYFA